MAWTPRTVDSDIHRTLFPIPMFSTRTLFLFLVSALVVRADVLPPQQDTFSSKGKLTPAGGKAKTLTVSATAKSFVLFNLNSLPASLQPGDIANARLRVYFPSVTKAGDISVDTVSQAWDETTVASEPAVTGMPIAIFPAAMVVAKKFVEVDVTATVQAWLATPATNRGFAFLTSGMTKATIGAKEGSGTGYPAELDVEIQRGTPAGSVGTSQLADGAVTSVKLATAAVGNAQIAANAVQSANIAAGAVGATQLAAGAVGFANLAKPPQAGRVDGSVLASTFGNGLFNVTFPHAYATSPVVSLAIHSANPTSAIARLTGVTSVGFSGEVSGYDLPSYLLDSAGDVGGSILMVIANGKPAIAYRDHSKEVLKFVRATDVPGTMWGAPITVDSSIRVASRISLAIVNGNPAISYREFGTGKLKYVRAIDADGLAWNPPVTIDNVDTQQQSVTLRVVDGNPAIACGDSQRGFVVFIRATDPDGITWGAAKNVVAGGVNSTMEVVNGVPAIAYLGSGATLNFVRASDQNGNTWGAPVVLADKGVSLAPSLAIVKNNPAIAYRDNLDVALKYIRAMDIDGAQWGFPINADSNVSISGGNTTVSQSLSLETISGRPAISYFDGTNSDLKYVHAADADGNAWGTPVALEMSGSVGSFSSLKQINGTAGIAFYDAGRGDLRFLGPINIDYQINWIALPP